MVFGGNAFCNYSNHDSKKQITIERDDLKMNSYIAMQILNAQSMAKNFLQSCNQAAKQDDGKISKEEEKTLKKIHAITERFINELSTL